MADNKDIYDLFVIGGGINGCGIARDASGRGLSICLAEMNDLASATSSASTKLFHGGLRYLEYFEFRLVREALQERETLLRAMPHIAWPLRFVIPLSPEMRFETDTPAGKLLSWLMPWAKGRRPNWMIRLGLFLYDHLGRRALLPGTSTLNLATAPEGAVLQARFAKAYEYSDVWVDDARLVVLNARDAQRNGAHILTRTRVVSAVREAGIWTITLSTGQRVKARALVNAGGPFVDTIIQNVTRQNTPEHVRLVRGSHIVVPKLFDHDKAYFFQGTDGRIIFAIPYEGAFTLIGTTDVDHQNTPEAAFCTSDEEDYLCAFASAYFKAPITPQDVIWRYSGIRPLYDDGAQSATAATRDYVLSLDGDDVPLLTVFGGKLTTYRRLAENALDKLSPYFPHITGAWTATAPLPGGDFPTDGVTNLVHALQDTYPFLSDPWALRLIRSYGTDAPEILGDAQSIEELGQNFGATLTEAEVTWLHDNEWARSAQDVVWRRTKLGLRMSTEEIKALQAWFDGLQLAAQ